eukprot:1832963-Ditylum_brightwellii.AAC.1
MASRERSSSLSRPPKPPTEAHSELDAYKNFPDVEISSVEDIVTISSIEDSVEVFHVNKWCFDTERSVEKIDISQRSPRNPFSE